MSKRKKRYREPPHKREANTGGDTAALIAFLNNTDFDACCSSDFIRLDECPEIVSLVRRIAETVGSMTVHLMKNTEKGDIRLHNELSRFLDITPCRTMNRAQWLEFIVSEALYTGNAIVRPHTRAGILRNLQPIPRWRYTIQPDITGYDYTVNIDGVNHDPDEICHFVYNPDKNYPFMGKGLTVPLKGLAQCLKAGRDLEKDFMTSKYMPSLIVRADGMTEMFQSKEGRHKLIEEFIETDRAGEPWVIPADQIEIKEVRPFSLADLAIDKTQELDLRKVAALFGVPPFLLGVGEYNQDEWNNFVQTKIRTWALYIGQELSRKLIYAPDWYVRLNYLSLMDYDVMAKGQLYLQYSDRGYVNGNEAREAVGMEPGDDPALEEFTRLENYIPANMSGDQKKLNQE